MKALDLALLALVPAMLSAGQMLFRESARALAGASLLRFFATLLASPHFWTALVVYGVATFLWVFVLSRVPLSRAIPFVALTFIIVPALDALFFGVRLPPLYWVGVALVAAGVSLSAFVQPAA